MYGLYGTEGAVKVLLVTAIIIFVCWLIWFYVHNPFKFPYIVLRLDVSKRRKPQITDIIDEYLNEHGMEFLEAKHLSHGRSGRKKEFLQCCFLIID